mmetsp:Transcript_35131/g.109787  ORF Transcript_35131/g.109787 Transcript_35131/m.109787 type:complete len:687 (-) Transcript_35131:497-2557(-)
MDAAVAKSLWLWLIFAATLKAALSIDISHPAKGIKASLRASSLPAPCRKNLLPRNPFHSISLRGVRGGSQSNDEMQDGTAVRGQSSSLESDDTMWTAPSDRRGGGSSRESESSDQRRSTQQDDDMEEDSGDDEFVDEDAIESDPIDREQFEEDARIDKLRRRQRFEEIVQRYNRSDVQEDLEPDFSAGDIAEYLGLPSEPPVPSTLHARMMEDIGAYQSCAVWDVSNVTCLEIVFDERTKIKIYPESLLSIQDALISCKAEQTIVIKPGDHVLRSPLQARLVETLGERPISLRGVQDPDFLKSGDAIDSLTGSNVYGRWSLESQSLGDMQRVTCIYNDAKDPDEVFFQTLFPNDKLPLADSRYGDEFKHVGQVQHEMEGSGSVAVADEKKVEYLKSLEEVSFEKDKTDLQTDVKGRLTELLASLHSLPSSLQAKDSTIVMNNCTWDFEKCRILTSKGICLWLDGASSASIAETYIGGLAFENYEGYVGIFIQDQCNAALLNCVMECFSNSAIRAADNSCVCLEYCRVNKVEIGVVATSYSMVQIENTHASSVFFGFLSVPHGGLEGPQSSQWHDPSIVLRHSFIEGNLWKGYGRASSFEIDNTTYTGKEDDEEEHRQRYAKLLEQKRNYLQGKGMPVDDVPNPEELDRAKFAQIQLQNFKELSALLLKQGRSADQTRTTPSVEASL